MTRRAGQVVLDAEYLTIADGERYVYTIDSRFDCFNLRVRKGLRTETLAQYRTVLYSMCESLSEAMNVAGELKAALHEEPALAGHLWNPHCEEGCCT